MITEMMFPNYYRRSKGGVRTPFSTVHRQPQWSSMRVGFKIDRLHGGLAQRTMQGESVLMAPCGRR